MRSSESERLLARRRELDESRTARRRRLEKQLGQDREHYTEDRDVVVENINLAPATPAQADPIGRGTYTAYWRTVDLPRWESTARWEPTTSITGTQMDQTTWGSNYDAVAWQMERERERRDERARRERERENFWARNPGWHQSVDRWTEESVAAARGAIDRKTQRRRELELCAREFFLTYRGQSVELRKVRPVLYGADKFLLDPSRTWTNVYPTVRGRIIAMLPPPTWKEGWYEVCFVVHVSRQYVTRSSIDELLKRVPHAPHIRDTAVAINAFAYSEQQAGTMPEWIPSVVRSAVRDL